MRELVASAITFHTISFFDSESSVFPEWGNDDLHVASTDTAVSVNARNLEDGAVHIRVLGSGEMTLLPASRKVVYDGYLNVESGVLKIGDGISDQELSVRVRPGKCHLRIYVDDPEEASVIDAVLLNNEAE